MGIKSTQTNSLSRSYEFSPFLLHGLGYLTFFTIISHKLFLLLLLPPPLLILPPPQHTTF